VFIANFALKSAAQKATVFLRRIADYSLRHPYRALEEDALAETVAFIKEEMPDALAFDTPRDLLSFALRRAAADGIVIECGVNEGGTIRFIAKKMPNRVVHGFDSFEGLPEDWSGNNMAAGIFNRAGMLPKVPPNVTLHKGWFDKTLPAFAAEHAERVALLHIDCDLYSSTKTVFDSLGGRIGPKTVIVFDEYFNYPHWRNHEHRAFREFVAARKVIFHAIGYAFRQVAVVVEQVGG
jgi:Methyltransferase domain